MNSSPRWPLLIIAVLALLAATTVFVTPRVQQRIHSAAYCASCHTEAASHVGGHSGTTCQSCHPLPEGQMVRLVWSALSGGRGMPPHGSLDETSCTTCHQKNERSWALLARTEGHSEHALSPVIAKCVRCHSMGLHGKPTPGERCESCHRNTITRREGVGSVECQRCHVFGAPHGPEQARLPGTWGADITGANVHGSADCRLCHNPHQPAGAQEAARAIVCTNCHRGELARSIAHAPPNHQQCTKCHRPHGLRTELATACAVCHQAPRIRGALHDPGVPPEMRELTTIAPILAARVGQPPPVLRVTHGGRCANCHEPHAWTPDRNVCRRCHTDKAEKIDRFPPNTHSCVGCHEPHSPPPNRDVCAECHTANAAGVRAAPVRHRDCLSCHQAHEGKPNAAVICGARCHQPQAAALRDGQVRHRTCTNCHTPHANPIVGAATRCQNCHTTEWASFSLGNKHQSCARCHSNHQFSRVNAQGRCQTCHQAPGAPGAAHPGPCLNCHTPHSPGRGPASNCATCHAARIHPQVPQHAANCAGCHKPHLAAETARTQCATCHADKGRVATAWPANAPHAPNRCPECHTAHDERHPKPCATCHANKQNQTHMGVHPTCIGCHAPHTPPPAGPSPARWWGRCGTCHTNEARMAATGRPEHQLCANCHNRPGRMPPTCITCHSQIPTVGMHQRPEHRNCLTCHTSHGTTPPVRANCVACHTDRRTHFADAPRCQSCHPFRPD